MPHQEPTNQRLWQMIIMQAKARFSTYPSPGASHWVHDQYIKHGGQFAEASLVTRAEKLRKRHFEEKRREALAERSERTKAKDKKGDEKKKGDKK